MAISVQRYKQWEKRIAHYRASGLSMAGYCRAHELSYAGFVWWRRRLEREVRTPLTLIPLVAPAPRRCRIVVRLPDGLGIEVESEFDGALLKAVVDALQVTPSC
jgi:hypothetical protein